MDDPLCPGYARPRRPPLAVEGAGASRWRDTVAPRPEPHRFRVHSPKGRPDDPIRELPDHCHVVARPYDGKRLLLPRWTGLVFRGHAVCFRRRTPGPESLAG